MGIFSSVRAGTGYGGHAGGREKASALHGNKGDRQQSRCTYHRLETTLWGAEGENEGREALFPGQRS